MAFEFERKQCILLALIFYRGIAHVFEAVEAEAIDMADNTKDEAKATDAKADEAKGHG